MARCRHAARAGRDAPPVPLPRPASWPRARWAHPPGRWRRWRRGLPVAHPGDPLARPPPPGPPRRPLHPTPGPGSRPEPPQRGQPSARSASRLPAPPGATGRAWRPIAPGPRSSRSRTSGCASRPAPSPAGPRRPACRPWGGQRPARRPAVTRRSSAPACPDEGSRPPCWRPRPPPWRGCLHHRRLPRPLLRARAARPSGDEPRARSPPRPPPGGRRVPCRCAPPSPPPSTRPVARPPLRACPGARSSRCLGV